MMAIPFVCLAGLVFSFIKDNLADMFIPVLVYMTIIGIMGTLSLVRINHTTGKSFSYTFVGSLLFMISDSLIGLSKFGPLKGPWVGAAIMMTYFFG